jgi:hypothetical protein
VTELLEAAMLAAERLPESEQDDLAGRILADVEGRDEREPDEWGAEPAAQVG